jgi:hypothetical protein
LTSRRTPVDAYTYDHLVRLGALGPPLDDDLSLEGVLPTGPGEGGWADGVEGGLQRPAEVTGRVDVGILLQIGSGRSIPFGHRPIMTRTGAGQTRRQDAVRRRTPATHNSAVGRKRQWPR